MAENRDRSGVVLLHDGGSNYPTWKIQIKMALIKQGVWGFITGTEIEPDEEGDLAAWRKFNDRSDKALATIVLAVDPALLYLLGDPQDPGEVWQQLSEQFEKKSWANKLALRRKLYSLRLKENESVQKHIKSMIEIFESLSVVGHVVEEEDRVVHILASLPDSFQMLVTALEASPEVPRLEVVLERLMHEEKKLKEKSEQRSKHPEDALLVRSKPSGGPVCFYCGKNGHIKKFCEEWKKKNEEEEVKSKKDKEESSFFCRRGRVGRDNDSDSDDIECIALISQASTVEHRKEWIIDSAASHHMCNNSSSMQNLRKLDSSQKIKVGNGNFVEAKAEGTVKLEINAGNSTRKFKLQKVLFAPELKFNLFSVPRAAKAGKTVEFGRQGCKIIENSTRKTVGSGRKKGNLYYVNCVRREERNSSGKCKERGLNSKQMQRALHQVSERKFEKEMMKRLERVEREVHHSYTIKEDNDQNQEDLNQEERKLNNEVQEDNKSRYEDQEDNKSSYEDQEDNQSSNEDQEDNQIQKEDADKFSIESRNSPEVVSENRLVEERGVGFADEKDKSEGIPDENNLRRAAKRFFSKFNLKKICRSRSRKKFQI